MVMWIQTEAGEWRGALIVSMSASSHLSAYLGFKNIDSVARGAGPVSGWPFNRDE
jgi:hypothetical protein